MSASKSVSIFFAIGLVLSILSPIQATQTVLLKGGKTLKGTVLAQNPEGIEIKLESGEKLSIPKKRILKIVYRDIALDEEEKIRKEEEARLLARKLELEKKQEQEAKEEDEKDAKELERMATQTQENSPAVSVRKPGFSESYLLYQNDPKIPLVLAGAGDKCEDASSVSQYFWLFGTYPLTRPDLSGILPQDGSSFRIRSESTWIDTAFTALGGFVFSLSRRTLVVETCENNFTERREKVRKELLDKIERERKIKEEEEEKAFSEELENALRKGKKSK